MRLLRSAGFVSLLLLAALSIQAKDQWTRVQSKNFLLIGNASEKEIRKVGTRLEQFRETFRLLFGQIKLVAPVQTNVVVFKSDGAYKPFKPKRSDGSIDEQVAGYFQPGEDVNYITLSTEGEDSETFATIFHEYVHFIVETNFGKSDVPPWFNEGLAEYYSTFAIEGDIKAKLGVPRSRHLAQLRQSRLMPLDQLLAVTHYQLLESGGHSRNIFYAESWALVHYLIQNGKISGLSQFLEARMAGQSAEKAFRSAFGMDYSGMEAALQKYVSQSTYQYHQVTFKKPLVFDAEMQAAAMTEAESNAYLGDLLYHNNRANDAEPFLVSSLKMQPDLSLANIALGMVKMQQKKYTEAREVLEKAIAGDPKNHVAFYRYAYLLSRENLDGMGYVRSFPAATASKMRDALKRAIAINPAFTESYELLAFVNVVNNEDLDDSVKLIQAALRYQPGNQRYAMRLAEIMSRQNKLDEAAALAQKIASTADDGSLRHRATTLMGYIAQKREYDQRLAVLKRTEGAAGLTPVDRSKPLSEDEIAKRQAEANLRGINRALRKPGTGEERLIGRVERIACRGPAITYTVRSGASTLTFGSKDFEGLTLNSFDAAAANVQVGCDENLAKFEAVVTYRPGAKRGGRGEVIAIEFVPAGFRLLTDDELKGGDTVVIYEMEPGKQD